MLEGQIHLDLDVYFSLFSNFCF